MPVKTRRRSDTAPYRLGAVLIALGIVLFVILDFMDQQGALSLRIGKTSIGIPSLCILSGLLVILPIGQWLKLWRKK